MEAAATCLSDARLPLFLPNRTPQCWEWRCALPHDPFSQPPLQLAMSVQCEKEMEGEVTIVLRKIFEGNWTDKPPLPFLLSSFSQPGLLWSWLELQQPALSIKEITALKGSQNRGLRAARAELGTILGAETTAGRRAALPSGSTEWGMGPHQHERAEAEARGLVHLGTCVGTSLTDAEHL